MQAQVRLRARGLIDYNGLPACYSARFRPTPWASQQKSRVETIFIPRLEAHRHQCPEVSQDETSLHLFAKCTQILRQNRAVLRQNMIHPRQPERRQPSDQVTAPRPLAADDASGNEAAACKKRRRFKEPPERLRMTVRNSWRGRRFRSRNQTFRAALFGPRCPHCTS